MKIQGVWKSSIWFKEDSIFGCYQKHGVRGGGKRKWEGVKNMNYVYLKWYEHIWSIPIDQKEYADKIVKEIDDNQEIKDHIYLLNEYTRNLQRHLDRIDKIKVDVVNGEKTWLELKEYERAIELMMKDITVNIYDREDSCINKRRPYGEIRAIFDERGRIEVKLLKATRLLRKFITTILKRQDNLIKYYQFSYYDKGINKLSKTKENINEEVG